MGSWDAILNSSKSIREVRHCTVSRFIKALRLPLPEQLR